MFKLGLGMLLGLAMAGPVAAADKPLPLPAAEAATRAQPKDASAWVALARSRIAAGKADQAIDAATRAVALAPRLAEGHYWLGNAYGNHMGDVGMFGKLKLAPKLRDAFERTVELDPGHLKARASLVEFYLLAAARIAVHDEDKAAALAAYRGAAAAAPQDPEVLYSVAVAYVYDKRDEEALPLLRKVVALDPSRAGAWYQIGRVAATSGKHLEEGGAALQRYLALPLERGAPERKHALYRLGQIQAQAGDRARARATWQQALKLDPDFEEVKGELAKG